MSEILCTGGAGYIGSHTVLALLENGFKVTIMDNLSNSSIKIISILEKLSGKTINFIKGDMLNINELETTFKENNFAGVVHFAAKKAVGESVSDPLGYYENNMVGLLNLLKTMRKYNCKTIVFSSSATVYKPLEKLIDETEALGASNPYGQTKFMAEQILQDLYISDKTWNISILRYFNPIGNHPSGLIGESPLYPNNLLPYIQQVAVGRRPHLNVFGNDWNTRDGTGVRDYLHVMDLADGHVAALNALNKHSNNTNTTGQLLIHNLGTGRGISVLELVSEFEKASNKKIPILFTDRREGDLATVVANPAKAQAELQWIAKRTTHEACVSAWLWQSTHPFGFEDESNSK